MKSIAICIIVLVVFWTFTLKSLTVVYVVNLFFIASFLGWDRFSIISFIFTVVITYGFTLLFYICAIRNDGFELDLFPIPSSKKPQLYVNLFLHTLAVWLTGSFTIFLISGFFLENVESNLDSVGDYVFAVFAIVFFAAIAAISFVFSALIVDDLMNKNY